MPLFGGAERAPALHDRVESHADVRFQVVVKNELDQALTQEIQIVLVEVVSDEKKAVALQLSEGV